jgi:hypothetical protein
MLVFGEIGWYKYLPDKKYREDGLDAQYGWYENGFF